MNKLIAGLLPALWTARAMWDVGKPIPPRDATHWTGDGVVVILLFTGSIAMLAFWAGKREGRA
jgi:hypothetical protein